MVVGMSIILSVDYNDLSVLYVIWNILLYNAVEGVINQEMCMLNRPSIQAKYLLYRKSSPQWRSELYQGR